MSEYLIGLTEKEIAALDCAITDLVAKQRELMTERDKAIKAKAEIERLFAVDGKPVAIPEYREPAKRGRKSAVLVPVPNAAEKSKRGPKAKANNNATNIPDGFNITKNIEAWMSKHKGGVKPQAIVIGIEQVRGVTLDARQVSFTLQALKKRGIVNNNDGFWHYSGARIDADVDHENDHSSYSRDNDSEHESSVAA